MQQAGKPPGLQCQSWILLQKLLGNIPSLGMAMGVGLSMGWDIPNLVLTNRARDIKAEQIPDFPLDNGSVPIFSVILIICNFCQYFQYAPSIIPLLRYIPRIDFNYASLRIQKNKDLGIHLGVFFPPKCFSFL